MEGMSSLMGIAFRERCHDHAADDFGALWDDCISEGSEISVHPTGNPINHS